MRFELIKNDFADHCLNHSATLSIWRRAKELNLHCRRQTRLAGERNEPVFAYPPVAEEVGVEPTRDWLLRTLFKSVATALWLALPHSLK